MNLFELLTVVFVVVVGYICGKFLGGHFGMAGWVIGVPLGLLLSFLLFYIFHKVFPRAEWLPICRQGKCRENDYQHLRNDDAGSHYVCTCGDSYLLVENRFLEVMGDGSTRAYMIRRKSGGAWEPDDEKTDGRADSGG